MISANCFFSWGVVAVANPLGVVESDTARVSVLPMESDTVRVSALPVVGIEVPAVYFVKVPLDSVGLRVGPSCLRLDPEETLLALMDERSVMSDVYLGVTLDGGPMEGAPVLEPLEHLVLEIALDDGPMEGAPILEPLEHSVLEIAPDGGRMEGSPDPGPLEHSVPEVILERRSRKKLSALEPLEHSVPEVILERSSRKKLSALEPLEHSVPEVILECNSRKKLSALEPLKHSVPEVILERSSRRELSTLEPLEHSVLEIAPDGGPMEGAPVLEPLEHSVLEIAPDGGPMEGAPVLETLEHSILEIALDSGLIKDWSVCEQLEHSVRMMTLNDSPMEKMSDDEPLEHSVLDAAVTCRRVVGAPVRPPLQCSIMTMGLVRGLRTEDGGPPSGPDHELTLSNGPHDRLSKGPVPLLAVDGGRVTCSSAEGQLPTGDGNSDGCITTGFQRWNMDCDVEDQYETINGRYSTNHVYLHRPNAFGFWQPRLHLCYETLKHVSNFSELA